MADAFTYELFPANADTLPITLTRAKSYLKIETDEDNAILADMIATVVQFAERYTGRDFRKKTWSLTIDKFTDRICLRKSQINSIGNVQYTVDGALVIIANTVYYLKKGYGFSEVLLQDGETWPTDLDDVEAGIIIVFSTNTPRYIEQYKTGLLEHLAFLYQNRGDCNVDSAAVKSGAIQLYGQGRIQRI